MKRLINLFLCMMLLVVSLSPPALASESRDANIVFTDGNKTLDIVDAAAGEDAVYALLLRGNTHNAAIGRWAPATGEAEILIPDKMIYHGFRYSGTQDAQDEIGIDRIFTNGNELYALDEIDMSIRRLVDRDGNVAVSEVLYSLADMMQEGSRLVAAFVQEGAFYLDIYTEEGEDAVIRCDLETGEILGQTLVRNVARIYPYADGKLLMTRYDPKNRFNPETGEETPYELSIYDPIGGEDQKIAMTESAMGSGMVYSKETGTIYTVSGSRIYALTSGADSFVLCGYLPTNSYTAMLMEGELYVTIGGEMLVARQLDPSGSAENVLTLYGIGSYSDEHMAVAGQNPKLNFMISNSNDILDFSDVAGKMITQENTIDIMTLNSENEPAGRVFQKGYAADLSVYPEIMERVATMDPAIISPFMQNGKLYAVPIRVSGHGLGYVPSVLEQLGMTEEELPKTFLELLEFIAVFQENYGDEHEDIIALDDMASKNRLFFSMIKLYVNQQRKDGEEIRFDTPLFRSLLTALERIGFSEFDPYEQYGEAVWDMTEVTNTFYQKDGLFTLNAQYSDPSGYAPDLDKRPLVLAIEDGKAPLAGIQVEVMMINAQSEQMEDAVTYVTEYMKNYNALMCFSLYPSMTEPVENPDYEDEMQELTANIEKTKRSLESASEENKAEQEDMLRNFEEKLAASDYLKMLITADEIAQYREKISPYLCVMQNWEENAYEDIYALQNRYLQKAIDADTFIREMDKRMNMMRLED